MITTDIETGKRLRFIGTTTWSAGERDDYDIKRAPGMIGTVVKVFQNPAPRPDGTAPLCQLRFENGHTCLVYDTSRYEPVA